MTSLSIQAFPESSLRLVNLTTGLRGRGPDLCSSLFRTQIKSKSEQGRNDWWTQGFLETTPPLLEEETERKHFYFPTA